ncbi:hypothetical protein ACFFGV_07615 [Pontibacillus salicampi]|uniref:Transporter n=1 Tax=Pontibacillus salicampi TaxID=1449801 RepID=A0ABV6LM29_9BACI
MYDPRQQWLGGLGQMFFPGSGSPGGFPGGPGGGFPGQQPPGPPPGQGGGGPQGGPQGPPPGPPPSTPPIGQQGVGGQPNVLAVDPGALYGCLYRYTWIRLNNGRTFWYYPTYIGRTSVAGYRWRRRQQRWVYYGIDTRQIASFSCY